MQDGFIEIQLMDVVSEHPQMLMDWRFLSFWMRQCLKIKSKAFLNATPFASSFLNSSFGNLGRSMALTNSVCQCYYQLLPGASQESKRIQEQIPT
ncbi:MAG: hypothetical protein IPL27_26470 [Lewinellaceae bacterium]|nr:hypothetical protein [Lewinellaceae bacterium]